MIDFDAIINEWSYRTHRGYPIWNDPTDMVILKDILKEMNLSLDSIEEASPKNPLAKGSSSTIEKSETPVLKEGLAVYFATQRPADLRAATKKVSDPKDNTILEFKPIKNHEYYGSSNDADVINNAIDFLNNNSITPNNSELFLNAISIANKIQSAFGQVDQTQIDRGTEYTKIREHAVKLVSLLGFKVKEDKWCPADIFIYNAESAIAAAKNSTSLNIDTNSMNALFNSEFAKGSTGIVGISLKEEKAQAGKAKSFSDILKKADNYPDAKSVTVEQKNTMELMYNLNILSVKKSSTPDKLKIGNVAEAARIITTRKVLGNTDALLESLSNTLKLTFGNSIESTKGTRGGLNKDVTRATFNSLKLNEIQYDPDLFTLIESYNDDATKDALDTYTDARKIFADTLQSQNFSVPGAPDTSKMNAETLYKKASCYLVAEYLLSGLNAEQLQIPPAYKSIIEQKNAFVALTAFAVGLGGISPTFFKLIGNRSGGPATLEPFYGSGILNLDDETDTIIVDSPGNKGFYVTFVTKVSLVEGDTIIDKEKYEVKLDFRYAGEQLNIEVNQFTEAE